MMSFSYRAKLSKKLNKCTYRPIWSEFCADPNNSIVELEQTGVLAEKEKLTQEKNQKQSALTAVSEPKPQPKTQTPLETHKKRLELQENKQATQISPQPEKPLQSENKPPIEPKPKTLKEYLKGLSHENRQKIKNHYNKVIND